MTPEEHDELDELQREDYLCSLGDRPQSMPAAKLRRMMELEQLLRDGEEEGEHLAGYDDE